MLSQIFLAQLYKKHSHPLRFLMKTNKVSGREAIGTYVLQFCVWGFERLRPLSRWEQGGVSRLIGFPLALAAGLIWSVYVAPIAFALSIILFTLSLLSCLLKDGLCLMPFLDSWP